MDGDILEIDVKYRSGCDEKITLHSTGMFKKSLPPQVDVFLQHNSTGECNEETETTLKFNISQLKYESVNRVIVNVNSADHKAEYQY